MTMIPTHREIKHGLSDLLELMKQRGDAQYSDHSGISLVMHDDGSGHCRTFYGDKKVFEFNDTTELIEWLAAPVVCKHCNGTGKHS